MVSFQVFFGLPFLLLPCILLSQILLNCTKPSNLCKWPNHPSYLCSIYFFKDSIFNSFLLCSCLILSLLVTPFTNFKYSCVLIQAFSNLHLVISTNLNRSLQILFNICYLKTNKCIGRNFESNILSMYKKCH